MQDRSPTGLELSVAGVAPSEEEAFSSVLSIPVHPVSPATRATPALEVRDRLLPGVVEKARRGRSSRRRNLFIAAAAFVAYVVFAAWVWIDARNTAGEIESMERQVEIVEPDVERIQRLEQRWRILEPAFDKKWFPVVQLSRVTSALPGSGVVVREFQTTGRDIRIRGEARDVQLAERLLEDLQAMDEFSEYVWSMPRPEVQNNNTARFDISGETKYAEADG